MSRVAIIGVGQSKFVRAYPGSVRELAFEGFKDAMHDAGLTPRTSGHPSSAPRRNTTNSGRRRVSLPNTSDSTRSRPFTWKASAPRAAWACGSPIPWSNRDSTMWWPSSDFRRCRKSLRPIPRKEWDVAPTFSGKAPFGTMMPAYYAMYARATWPPTGPRWRTWR